MANPPPAQAVRTDGSDVLIDIKVVPGASRSRVQGPLGNRLKIALSCPPQKGRANRELVQLLASCCGIHPRCVTIERGATSPLKTVRIRESTVQAVRTALTL